MNDQKRVPSTHATEVAGELEVQRVANAAGWLHRPRSGPDVGVDLELEPVREGVPSGLIIKVQVKSGTSYFERDDGHRFAFRVRPADRTYWARLNTPLLLVLFNPNEGVAYAVEFHSYTRAHSDDVTNGLVWFDRAKDALTVEFLNLLVVGPTFQGQASSPGPSPRAPTSEVLWSNLLRLDDTPQRLFHAPTTAKNEAEAKARIVRGAAPCLFWSGELWSFSDPREPGNGLLAAIDSDRVRVLDAAVWLCTKDGDIRYRTLLYRHLRQHTRSLGLFRDDDDRLFFPSRNGEPRVQRYRSLRQWTQRWVARPVYDGTRTRLLLWEHRSLKTELLRLGNDWMLSILPAWTFSSEGRRATSAPPGAVTRRISHEYNHEVFRLIVFWNAVLFNNERRPMVLKCAPQQIVISEELLACRVPFGIETDRLNTDTLDAAERDDSPESIEDAAVVLEVPAVLDRGEHGSA